MSWHLSTGHYADAKLQYQLRIPDFKKSGTDFPDFDGLRESAPTEIAGLCFFERVAYNEIMDATCYRYLVDAPDVCGGKTVIDNTRIGVHDVVGLFVNGAGVDDVLRSFPTLTRAQVYECLAYYEDHRPAIDALIAEQMAETLE